MDDDLFRRYIKNIPGDILFIFIKLVLIVCSNFNITSIYILSNTCFNKIIRRELLSEGYCLTKVYKGIYLVHPVLYERK